MDIQKIRKFTRQYFFIVFAVFFITPFISNAEIFQSSSFRILDPVISSGAERSTSASFILSQSLGEFALGSSTASSFQLNPGFLTFPAVTLPTVTATAGDAQVSLSWTTASGALGWTVGGYNVGQSTTSGGPYTYTSLGNVTSSTRTGLTNGTQSFFVIRPEDAFGNSIATSTEVSATPVAAAPTPPPRSGGGGPPSLITIPWIPPPVVSLSTEIERERRRAARLAGVDFNNDNVIDLVDFSILLFFLDKPISIAARYDLNNDRTLDLVDVSILFYYWGTTDLYT